MSDTTAPVLLGLDIPATIDLSKGGASVAVGVQAKDDAGGSGIRSVVVEFADHFWTDTSTSSSLLFDRWSSGDNFEDATPASASATLRISNLTQSGNYDIARVVVEDMAGNRTSYDPAQLQALGIRTTVAVTGGIVDTAAPSLVGLTLPATVDLSAGFSQFITPTGVARDSGAAGVASVWITFDKPLGLEGGSSNRLQLFPQARVQDGGEVGLIAMPALAATTPAGVYNVTGVTLSDYLGNTRDYGAAELRALGIGTAITVTGSAAVPPAPPAVLPTAALSLAAGAAGAVLTVTPESWGAADADTLGLQLRFNANVDRFVGAALTGGATGELTVAQDGNGLLTITGKNITGAAAGAGIAVTMAPVHDGTLASFEFMGFTLNGVQHRDTGAARAVDYYRGSGADERIDYAVLPELVDGGGGLDVLRVHGARADYRLTQSGDGFVLSSLYGTPTILADVERLAFDDGRVALDTDGAIGQLYRLYQAAFDRTPDGVGIGYWLARMEEGVALRQVADAFVASAEFAGLVGPAAGARDFVTALYDNVLHRAPDPEGLAFWLDSLERGLGRSEMLVYFSESPEHVAQLVGTIQNGIDYQAWTAGA